MLKSGLESNKRALKKEKQRRHSDRQKEMIKDYLKVPKGKEI